MAARTMATQVSASEKVLNEWLWTWSGICFGYRRRDSLFTYDGREVGRFDGKQIYGPDVHYIGELKDDRLIVKEAGKSQRRGTFVPAVRIDYEQRPNVHKRALPAGYEDFPGPDAL